MSKQRGPEPNEPGFEETAAVDTTKQHFVGDQVVSTETRPGHDVRPGQTAPPPNNLCLKCGRVFENEAGLFTHKQKCPNLNSKMG